MKCMRVRVAKRGCAVSWGLLRNSVREGASSRWGTSPEDDDMCPLEGGEEEVRETAHEMLDVWCALRCGMWCVTRGVVRGA